MWEKLEWGKLEEAVRYFPKNTFSLRFSPKRKSATLFYTFWQGKKAKKKPVVRWTERTEDSVIAGRCVPFPFIFYITPHTTTEEILFFLMALSLYLELRSAIPPDIQIEPSFSHFIDSTLYIFDANSCIAYVTLTPQWTLSVVCGNQPIWEFIATPQNIPQLAEVVANVLPL